MTIQLTARGMTVYDTLRSGTMSPRKAAEYLRDGHIVFRTFSETLREQYPFPDLRERLTMSLQSYDTETSPKSVARKVQNWLDGKNRPTSREDIFRIAFALDLTEAQTNFLLGQCTGYGIHYREPKDVIYTWFLRNDLGYDEARAFFVSLPPVPRLTSYPDVCTPRITRELQLAFSDVSTPEALRRTYLANLDKFGQLHVRAYHYFEKYLDQLIHPSSVLDDVDEQRYSLEQVMDKYLSLHMPSGRSRGRYSVVQKLLKCNWPNATALKNIRAHKSDVPRKLLLLLYIITENVVDDDYSEIDEDYLTLQDRLEDHWWTLNAILMDCGMPLLDPRNAMDWLVLYALTADDGTSTSVRTTDVIDQLFDNLT